MPIPRWLKTPVNCLQAIGLDRLRFLARVPRFMAEFLRFRRLSRRPDLPVRVRDLHPQLGDRTATTSFDAHYVYHPAWAARILAQTKPAEHVDISSSLTFCAMLSAFVPVRFYDYRPAALQLSGLQTGAADLTRLPFADGSIASLSCMHVIEHVGLGRYGDPLDAQGDCKALAELKRVLAPGGNLLLVVPVGRPRVCYNAHRIYSREQIERELAGLTLQQFALLPDSAQELIVDASSTLVSRQEYGCGCFWFKKEA